MNGNRETVKRSVLPSIVLSVPMIVLGARGIVMPSETGEDLTTLLGCLLVLSGVTDLVSPWRARDSGKHRSKALLVRLGIVLIITGGSVLLHSKAELALVLGVMLTYLLGNSIVDFILRYRFYTLSGSSWLSFEGLANGLILAMTLFLIWASWPAISNWVVGILVGTSMLFSGIARLMVALTPHRAVETLHEEYHDHSLE